MERRKFLAGASLAAGAAAVPTIASAQGQTHRWKPHTNAPSNCSGRQKNCAYRMPVNHSMGSRSHWALPFIRSMAAT